MLLLEREIHDMRTLAQIILGEVLKRESSLLQASFILQDGVAPYPWHTKPMYKLSERRG
jgi:hypothetical protein